MDQIPTKLLTTAFMRSWVADARSGVALETSNIQQRSGAWAQWAILQLVEHSGAGKRKYISIDLPGKFYNPNGRGPVIAPHLELPRSVTMSPAPEFPLRLALAGNALLSPWWVPAEALAAKRAILSPVNGDISEVAELLESYRIPIVSATDSLLSMLSPLWSEIETLLVADPDGLTKTVCAEIKPDEMAEFLPDGLRLNLRAIFDTKLQESAGAWASRRTGVWQLQGITIKESTTKLFALGVLTPRLTRNSQLKDGLFKPEVESVASLLIRSVILRRLASKHLNVPSSSLATVALLSAEKVKQTTKSTPIPHLRSIVPRVSAGNPRASIEAAANFLHNFPRADYAWGAIGQWIETAGGSLTISWDEFYPAHSRARKAIRRAEEIDREDIDKILPICLDSNKRAVRLTYSRAEQSESSE